VAISAHHSGDWLFALPILSYCLKLDDEVARVTVRLCVGINFVLYMCVIVVPRMTSVALWLCVQTCPGQRPTTSCLIL